MKQKKKDQNPNPQDEKQQRTNTPTGGQQQTPGKAQEMPPRHDPPRAIDIDEEDEELDPRQRRPA
jgi:hypothetical protein